MQKTMFFYLKKISSSTINAGLVNHRALEHMPKKAEKATVAALHGFAPYTAKKGEEYMNDAQQEHFKNILLAWKRELMEEVDRTVTHMKDEAANFPDPADRATQEEEFSLELRTRDRERKLIKKIDSTIERIESDDYGFCDQCGVDIGVRRLEARPTANLCVDCKTLDEIKEKQLTGG
jgi:DnaK suppressor protein